MTQEEQLNQIRVSLLQLQRSALLDTQTVMQILLNKNVCELSELLEVRSQIESASEDIKRIDKQILECGGVVEKIPQPDPELVKPSVQSQLDQLEKLLKQIAEINK